MECTKGVAAWLRGTRKLWKYGAGDGDRTRDVQLGKLAFYQLNYPRFGLMLIITQTRAYAKS